MSDIQVQHTYLHVWYLYFSNVVCFTAKAELVLKKKAFDGHVMMIMIEGSSQRHSHVPNFHFASPLFRAVQVVS